jgi:hypothetical protein
MTKLYTVTIEYEYVIAVEDGEDPHDVAEETCRDVLYDISARDVDIHAYETNGLPAGWDSTCYPYRCEAQERTIGEILKENSNAG